MKTVKKKLVQMGKKVRKSQGIDLEDIDGDDQDGSRSSDSAYSKGGKRGGSKQRRANSVRKADRKGNPNVLSGEISDFA